jgi:hypothetical protein
LQAYFITLRAVFPADADAFLKRVELQAAPRVAAEALVGITGGSLATEF